MPKFREITLKPLVWNTYVSVMIGGSRPDWLDVFKRCYVHPEDRKHFAGHMDSRRGSRGAVTMYSRETPGNVFVYFPRPLRHTDPQDHGAVAHEMLHVSHKILSNKGLTLSDETEEAFAYLHEFLTRELWAKVLRMVVRR